MRVNKNELDHVLTQASTAQGDVGNTDHLRCASVLQELVYSWREKHK